MCIHVETSSLSWGKIAFCCKKEILLQGKGKEIGPGWDKCSTALDLRNTSWKKLEKGTIFIKKTIKDKVIKLRLSENF